MMKQAVYALLPHAFNFINSPWKAVSWTGFEFEMAECSISLSRSIYLNFTPPAMTGSKFSRFDQYQIVHGCTSAGQYNQSRIVCLWNHPYPYQVLYSIASSHVINYTVCSRLRAVFFLILCNIYTETITMFICILIIWSLVISIPYRSLGLDSDWLTCSVTYFHVPAFVQRIVWGDHSKLHSSLRLLRFPSRVLWCLWAH